MDYSSTGGMRSPFSPRVRQSISGRRQIGLSSVKKNQSIYDQSSQQQTGDVIYKTANSTIETYGMPLPVMVTEALTFGSGDVSVSMSPSGWCWVVTGRRVLAWPIELAGSSGPAAARELILPQTDLAHKADLVVIFYEDHEQSMPSCVGVSPEGVVRYWPSIGQEGAYSEVSCELAGQECDRLVYRVDSADGTVGSLLLATTTCTLVRISTNRESRAGARCHTLRPPSGWLGGIGRRVSHLFFGSMPHHTDTKLVGVVILPPVGEGGGQEEGEGGELACLVAGGPLLQTWSGAALHEHHLRRALLDAAARAHLAPSSHTHGEPGAPELAALDVRAAGARALLLLLALDARLALAHISVERPEAPRVVGVVGVGGAVGAVGAAGAGGAARCLPLGARALLYSPAGLALVPATPSLASEKAECVDAAAEGDRVLGAAAGAGAAGALLFTRKHGVLAVRSAAPPAERQLPFSGSPLGSPTPSDMYDGNLTLYEIDPNEISATTGDAAGKLKAAFLFHLRRDASAGRLLAELFPARGAGAGAGGGGGAGDVDAPLDRTVLAVAAEMLDDVPAGDPRWRILTGSSRVALGASGALHAAGQLRDKLRAFTLFLDFLRAHDLWRRLGHVSREGGAGRVRTVRVLRSLAERLGAARAVQRLHQTGALLVGAAMQQVAEEQLEEEEPEVARALAAGALGAADVVLRRVTRVPRVLRALAALPAPAAPAAAAAHALQTLTALTAILSEMQKVRSQWAAWGEDEPEGEPCEELPALVRYHTAAVTGAARGGPAERAQLLQAAAALADLLLGEAAALPEPRRRALRRALIEPYRAEGQPERAAALAEKFRDFELLVELSARDEPDRLHGYIDKYEHEGMAEIAFAWLASRSGAERAQLVRDLGSRRPARLARWLVGPAGSAAPADLARRQLLALHQLGRRPPHRSAATLLALAADERDSLDRMVIMASLAKLCLAASEEGEEGEEGQEGEWGERGGEDEAGQWGEGGEEWRCAEALLSVGAQQRALPRDVRLHYGLDERDMRRMDPEELVQMYIECESKALTEYDYKKALDLTDFVEDPDVREDLRLKVWCACVAREQWEEPGEGAGPGAGRDERGGVFHRLIDLLNVMGADVRRLLPPLELLLQQPALRRVAADPRRHYLLKCAYAALADPAPDSPRSPHSPHSPHSPRSPHSPHANQ